MAKGRYPRLFAPASPVKVTQRDGTTTIQPAMGRKQLDRFIDRAENANSGGQTNNRPVTVLDPCPCGSKRFWDNRRYKQVGKFSATQPDLRCVNCRQGRWLS